MMTCKDLNANLDDYVDNRLDSGPRAALEVHVADCESCRQRVDEARRLQAMLKEYGESDVSVPETAFFDQALARAARKGTRQERNRYWMKGFGSAIAASLALFAVTLMFLRAPDPIDAGVPGVTMALEQPQTVNLVFASATDLVDATLTIVLPDGVDIAGFEGQREITWMTSLKAGRNVVPLQLIATSSHGGELLATLRHEDDDRTFRLQVTVI